MILWLQPPSRTARGCAQQAALEIGASGSLYLLTWHHSCCWAGEPQRWPCAEAAVPGKPGEPNGSSGTAPPQRWGLGFPAAVRQSSPRAQESCQPLQPLQQVSAEGLNTEPDVRQDWLCPVGRSALRGELHPCYPLCFCLRLYRCQGWRKKIVVPNPVQKVSFGFFKFFPPY